MKIYGVQLDIQWENKTANFNRVRELLHNAAPEPGSLIVLPEMFATGFSMNVNAIAEESDGPTEEFIWDLARDTKCIIVAGTTKRHEDGRGRNEAVAFEYDENKFMAIEGEVIAGTGRFVLCVYDKYHPFSFSGEDLHYAAGNKLTQFEWQDFKCTPFICYDLRFPEIFRAVTKHGTNLFCVIANWPVARDVHWRALLLARAIENQAYVIGVNRCGDDPKLHYAGRSQIISPRGEIIADAGSDEGVISAELDLGELENYRREFPALQDMKFVERFP